MATSFQLTGKYLGCSKVKTVGQNNTQVRSFWLDVTDNPQYPNTPEFGLRGDRIYLPDSIAVGQQITVHFNLNGRKYDKTASGGGKGVINNIDCWKIDIVQTQSAAAPPSQRQAAPAPRQPAQSPISAQYQAPPFDDDESNDLPF